MDDLAAYLDSVGARPSAGSEMVLRCPFCSRSGHLYVNVEAGETWDGKKKPAGRWICFGCGEKSQDFARLMAELDSIPFREARATIAKWRLDGLKFIRPQDQVIMPEGQWLPPEYESCDEVWPKYLTRRNISRDIAKQFKLGVCRHHDKCDKCKPSGGCPRNMANRIILPIECPGGRSFQGRAILPDMEPRYLSGENSGMLLFGWHTIAESDTAAVVEGPFDALKVAQAGIPVVALMGKDLRDPQAQMLRKRRRKYVVALDPMDKDALAIDNACDIAEQLGGEVVTLLETDPGDSTEAKIQHAFMHTIAPQAARLMALQGRLGKRSTWR